MCSKEMECQKNCYIDQELLDWVRLIKCPYNRERRVNLQVKW